MHRSGTSAFGGSLARLGVAFGDRLAPPAPDNEKGFWEHPEIVALHDQLLHRLGSKWDDDSRLPAGWPKRKETRAIQAALTSLVVRDFADKNVFGIKDPRLSRLLPLWLPIFTKLAVKPCFVVMVRHPWEIAESLRKRNGIPLQRSVLLWLHYTLEAERSTRGQTRWFVRYDELLSNAAPVLASILRTLNLPQRSAEAIQRKLGGFLERSLRHHRAQESNRKKKASAIPSAALAIYDALLEATLHGDIPERMNGLLREFERFSALFQPRLDELARTTAGLQDQLNAGSVLSSQLQQENQEQNRRLLQLQSDLGEKAKHVSILQRENGEKTQQVLHFKGDAEEKAKHISLLQQENKEKTKQILHFKGDAKEKAKHISLLQQENKEKTKQILHFKGDAEEKAKHVSLLQQENKEKTKQILHFKGDAEEKAKHVSLLQQESEEKTKQVIYFQADGEEKAKQAAHFQREIWEKAKYVALLVRENEEKTKQVFHFRGDAEEKARHIGLLQRENEEKTKQVFHFKDDAEEKAKHVALLQRENEEKTKQVLHFKKEAEDKTGHIIRLEGQALLSKEQAKRIRQLQDDLKTKSDQILTLRQERDEGRDLIERLNWQLAQFDERLKRRKRQWADAQWKVMTLRKRLLQQRESTQSPPARFLELQNHALIAEGERDQLRSIVRALQEHVEQERLRVQRTEEAHRTTTERLQKTTNELRSQRKQMDRLKKRLTGRLILPFGKRQRTFRQLVAVEGGND